MKILIEKQFYNEIKQKIPKGDKCKGCCYNNYSKWCDLFRCYNDYGNKWEKPNKCKEYYEYFKDVE